MPTPLTDTKAMVPAELRGLRPAGHYTFDELYRFAQMCHSSGLFEDTKDAAQAMIKIVKGQELGLPPTTAMAAFDIIAKRLFIKPWAIAAKINSCGYGGYRIVIQTPEACTIVFRRRYPGFGWQDCPPVSYTHAEAQAHGLVNRSPHWKTSPAHMLYLRAMGRGGAMYFPELLAGLEPPPDDTPVPPERHAQNIIELFGDDPRGSTPQAPRSPVVDQTTGEVIGSDAGTPEQLHGAPGRQNPPSASADPDVAWRRTLRAHQGTLVALQQAAKDDPDALERLDTLAEAVDFALSPLSTTSDSEGLTLAADLLDWVDAR